MTNTPTTPAGQPGDHGFSEAAEMAQRLQDVTFAIREAEAVLDALTAAEKLAVDKQAAWEVVRPLNAAIDAADAKVMSLHEERMLIVHWATNEGIDL
jgi:hypothetical protein